jgi:hypothetical protein
MRVTKLIREYVEKTITAKMPYGAPSAEYKAACSKMSKLEAEVNNKVTAYAKKLCEEATAQLPEGFYIKLQSKFPITSNSYDSPLSRAAGSHERAMREKRAEAIESILLELELGATKADLERLIAEALDK